MISEWRSISESEAKIWNLARVLFCVLMTILLKIRPKYGYIHDFSLASRSSPKKFDFLRPQGAKNRIFRVNCEMRGKISVYNPNLDEFWTKLTSKHKTRLWPNFKFWLQIQKSIFIPKSKINVQNRSLLFLSNLVSRHQNSNSPLSIWSESSSLNFSSTKILILY